MKGANDLIKRLKKRIKPGDKIISRDEEIRGGTVEEIYEHFFTVKTPKGYMETLMYTDFDKFLIKGVDL